MLRLKPTVITMTPAEVIEAEHRRRFRKYLRESEDLSRVVDRGSWNATLPFRPACLQSSVVADAGRRHAHSVEDLNTHALSSELQLAATRIPDDDVISVISQPESTLPLRTKSGPLPATPEAAQDDVEDVTVISGSSITASSRRPSACSRRNDAAGKGRIQAMSLSPPASRTRRWLDGADSDLPSEKMPITRRRRASLGSAFLSRRTVAGLERYVQSESSADTEDNDMGLRSLKPRWQHRAIELQANLESITITYPLHRILKPREICPRVTVKTIYAVHTQLPSSEGLSTLKRRPPQAVADVELDVEEALVLQDCKLRGSWDCMEV
ncbi:uncharacterized protein CTHT_0007320 [Thermochaetoides thermophila DSM 1495]|uniref:Uncharacterized protein n=1 Tax=Chaetomium thermophilum (strain DSM 1495 / CBS 144.50 / IMI 039719) TaxID=759272 RepID=G0RYN5_CHATD|nr:hypothetical protein CTHT_0007320 [Thermochaetoides thermophila DSM 1495]EGS24021.1 hypothetical protein CTHT_0007320 [Thermochaetoides thermophila DSM 1495]